MEVTPPGGITPPNQVHAAGDDWESSQIWYAMDDMAQNEPDPGIKALAAHIRDYLYSHGMQFVPRAQVEAYIDSVLESKDDGAAGQGDVYMRFGITNPLDLYNPNDKDAFTFDWHVYDYTQPEPNQDYDGWTPSGAYLTPPLPNTVYPAWTGADTWYFSVVNYSAPADLKSFQTAVENELKALQSQAIASGSPVTDAQVQQALAGMVFNLNLPSYGITNPNDLISFLSTLSTENNEPTWAMPAGIQPFFNELFNAQYQSFFSNPTAPAWLSQLQNIWSNPKTAEPLDQWANAQIQNPSFFSNLSLDEFNQFLSISGASFTDSSVATALWDVGTALAGMPKTDPGYNFYLAFSTQRGGCRLVI